VAGESELAGGGTLPTIALGMADGSTTLDAMTGAVAFRDIHQRAPPNTPPNAKTPTRMTAATGVLAGWIPSVLVLVGHPVTLCCMPGGVMAPIATVAGGAAGIRGPVTGCEIAPAAGCAAGIIGLLRTGPAKPGTGWANGASACASSPTLWNRWS